MTKLDIFLMREAVKNICSPSKEVPITNMVLLSLLDNMEGSDANGAKVSEVIREALSEFLSKSRHQHSN